jgi:hypothetical protein
MLESPFARMPCDMGKATNGDFPPLYKIKLLKRPKRMTRVTQVYQAVVRRGFSVS